MTETLSALERVSLKMRELYKLFGYSQYKVGKFEEYDFYAQNKNFLSGEQVLTFNDTDGRLMALKPDITMSIIKNTKDEQGTRKLWYNENVYRVPRNSYGFKEIVQTGLEYIGGVDVYAQGEVLMLAAESLKTISSDYVLAVSHMGLLTGLAKSWGLSDVILGKIREAFGGKNRHELKTICEEACLDKDLYSEFCSLCNLCGKAGDVLRRLEFFKFYDECRPAIDELEAVLGTVAAFGDYNINIDLSVTDDTDYYNGIIFRGFVDGVSLAVLAGGRYDELMNRLGKGGSAIGFAVYISELERLLSTGEGGDADLVIGYGPNEDPAALAAKVKEITMSGKSVKMQREEAI